MLKKRLIAVIIIRDGTVVQSVRFKHTNVIHSDPIHAIETFSRWSVDEIVLLDVSRSKPAEDTFVELVDRTARRCFVPLSIGGWITDDEKADRLLKAGADKLVLNTAFEDDPELVQRLSKRYGQQCIVASIDAKCTEDGKQYIAVDRARRIVEHGPADWAERVVGLGAGEIFLNSVEHDGARRGYNLPILKDVSERVSVPVIAFGGVMFWKHLADGYKSGASAVAAANIFHYKEHATRSAKTYLAEEGFEIRNEGRSFRPGNR
ncbi:MAG: imidazole glycerol phosphate synthase cyclase subunit [Pseudomonadota bacterium]